MFTRFGYRRGVTALEVLVGAFAALIVIVFVVWLLDARVRRGPVTQVKDATQLSQLHKAMYTFSRQFDGRLPRPGLINRMPDPQFGNVPGFGDEDISLNTTANLYSCLIAQNFITPQVVISPVEANPVVVAKNDYNMEAYDPDNDVYWDETFAADLETGSNTSYAHLPLIGERAVFWWRDAFDPDRALLSDRGPKDGLDDPESYTYQFFGRGKSWIGNVCFADGHAEYLESFIRTPASGGSPDNLFSDADGFNFLTFTKEVAADGLGIVPQWD